MTSFNKAISGYKSIGIDTICFIYHFEGNKTYGELVKSLFLKLQEGKIRGVTSVLTIAEVLTHEKLQKNRVLLEEEKTRLYATPNLVIIPVDEIISEAAAALKYRYSILLPDAIQLATAIVSSQGAFITNDQRLKVVREVKVLVLDDFKS